MSRLPKFQAYFSLDFSLFPLVQAHGQVGEACRLPPNVYFPWTPDYTLSCRVHACLSEHSDLSFCLSIHVFAL